MTDWTLRPYRPSRAPLARLLHLFDQKAGVSLPAREDMMDEIRDEITRVARDFFLKSGCREGHDLENWLAAEELVRTWHLSFEEREKHVGAHEEPQSELWPGAGSDEVVH